MKTKNFKILFIVLISMAFTAVAFGQQDSAFVNYASTFGLDKTMLWTIVGVVTWLLGHFAIPNKWASLTLYAEKISYSVYLFFAWINKTNTDKKSNESK